MVRFVSMLLVFLAVGATMPTALSIGGHDRMAGQMAGGHEHQHHDQSGSHEDRPVQGALHCPSFQCVTPFIVQVSNAWERYLVPLMAFGPVRSDAALLQAILERDPPVPRISI